MRSNSYQCAIFAIATLLALTVSASMATAAPLTSTAPAGDAPAEGPTPPATGVAEDDNQPRAINYQVEVLVFSRDQRADRRARSYVVDTRDTTAPSESAGHSIVWSAPQLLTRQSERLSAAGYRILLHQAWQQSIVDRQQPTRVRVHDNRPITLLRSQFRNGLATVATALDNRPDAENTIPQRTFRLDGKVSTQLGRNIEMTIELTFNPHRGQGLRPGLLKAERTIRSGETHYFDSEQLGALVKITRR